MFQRIALSWTVTEHVQQILLSQPILKVGLVLRQRVDFGRCQVHFNPFFTPFS